MTAVAPTVEIVPVIMSGGSGMRLWPLSTEAQPKQFHALAARRTMLQETALRLSGEGASRDRRRMSRWTFHGCGCVSQPNAACMKTAQC